jgi:mannose-6-phosphate isomerase-like protein (cupin superfamily)
MVPWLEEEETVMAPLPQEDPSASVPVALDQMVFSPLAGQIGSSLGSDFVIAEWRDRGAPPGPPVFIAPVHLHNHDDEAWYVLEGMLAFRLGHEQVEAGAGTLVFAPHGVAHTFWNPRPEPARYLLIMTPNIRRLIDDLHATTDHSPETIAAIYQQHDSALVSEDAE